MLLVPLFEVGDQAIAVACPRVDTLPRRVGRVPLEKVGACDKLIEFPDVPAIEAVDEALDHLICLSGITGFDRAGGRRSRRASCHAVYECLLAATPK